jgi:hypothetical protein
MSVDFLTRRSLSNNFTFFNVFIIKNIAIIVPSNTEQIKQRETLESPADFSISLNLKLLLALINTFFYYFSIRVNLVASRLLRRIGLLATKEPLPAPSSLASDDCASASTLSLENF